MTPLPPRVILQALQPIFRQEATLIAGVRPQSLRAMSVGGGPARPVMVFASIRPSDGAPVLTVLDTDTAIAAAAAAGSGGAGASGRPSPSLSFGAPGGGDGDGSLSREGLGLGEVELSTRCCSKSVFAASPHAVFVEPAGIKAFVCGGGGGGGTGGRGGGSGGGGEGGGFASVPEALFLELFFGLEYCRRLLVFPAISSVSWHPFPLKERGHGGLFRGRH